MKQRTIIIFDNILLKFVRILWHQIWLNNKRFNMKRLERIGSDGWWNSSDTGPNWSGGEIIGLAWREFDMEGATMTWNELVCFTEDLRGYYALRLQLKMLGLSRLLLSSNELIASSIINIWLRLHQINQILLNFDVGQRGRPDWQALAMMNGNWIRLIWRRCGEGSRTTQMWGRFWNSPPLSHRSSMIDRLLVVD